MKDEHTYGKKMARYGHNTIVYKGTFVSNHSLFSFVWLGKTKVSQAAAGRNLWIDPSKYPRKYPKNHVRQWANDLDNFSFKGEYRNFGKY